MGSITVWRAKDDLFHCNQRITCGKGGGDNSQRGNYEAIFGRRIGSSNESALEQEEVGQETVCCGETREGERADEGGGGWDGHFASEPLELAEASLAADLKHDLGDS